MAKKSRRAQVPRQVAEPVRAGQAHPTSRAEAPSGQARPTLRAEAPSKGADFRVEYHYVVEDLKRIAIIAFALLVLVVVLALVIA